MMGTTTSSLYPFPPSKQRSVFRQWILPLAFLSVSLLRPPTNSMAHGFIERTIVIRRMQHSVLVHCKISQNGNQENNEDWEDEQRSSGNGNGIDNDDIVQALPVTQQQDISLPRQLPNDILTSIEEKQRRERERSLLAQVQKGDNAIKELRRLWGSQSGNSREEELLYQASRGIGDPTLWDESREILEKLTIENPTFLEPFARLSKLYCLMGRLEDSQIMALEVLNLKPWHILAIETMVATSYALNQIETSMHWASQRMPPPSQTEKRKEWIRRAMKSSLEFEYKLLVSQRDEEQETESDDDNSEDEHSFLIEKDAWQ
jgi:hypothetical protein